MTRTRNYEYFAQQYANIKPIRGRPDCRPIGDRRNTHKTITQKILPCGEKPSYALKFHNTECVEYFPNGDIVVRTGNWNTPLTAEFIYMYSPFKCWKQYNKIWVNFVDESANGKNGVSYPVNKELTLQYEGEWEIAGQEKGAMYKPVGDVSITKRVVDRAKAKAARSVVEPFLNFAKLFLTLSDGWIMNETVKEHVPLKDGEFKYKFYSAKDLYERMQNNPDEYIVIMCYLLSREEPINKRIAETHEQKFDWGIHKTHLYDEQFKFETLKRKAYAIVEGAENIYTTKEVSASGKAMTNVV
jgi:hypothetical protein